MHAAVLKSYTTTTSCAHALNSHTLTHSTTRCCNTHTSLISFHGAFLKDGSINVILEFMDLGSLKEVIHDWKHIDYDELVIGAAAFQMLWGLAYLHFERRLHRDIKPQVSALYRYFCNVIL
jgi:serine/threonine protein kinase